MAATTLDPIGPSTNFEDATWTGSGSASGVNVQVEFDNASDPVVIDACFARAIAIITQKLQEI